MKRFAVLLLALAMTVCCAMPAFAAGTIEVTEDVSVSDDYDWTIMFVVILCIILISNAMESRSYRRDQKALRGEGV